MKHFLAFVLLASGLAFAEEPEFELGHIHLGATFKLAPMPEDSDLNASFSQLTEVQRQTFYERRRFLLTKLIGALSFPRTLGAMSWAKGKVKFALGRIKNRSGAIEQSDDEHSLSLKERGQRRLQNIVDVFSDRLWRDAAYIATAHSVGFRLYCGPVINTSVPKWGFFWGRGLSIDIGHNFDQDQGYVRFYYDRSALKTAGLSLDVGAMFDFFIHFTNADREKDLNITHYKLPLIGSYRTGPQYRG